MENIKIIAAIINIIGAVLMFYGGQQKNNKPGIWLPTDEELDIMIKSEKKKKRERQIVSIIGLVLCLTAIIIQLLYL